MAGEPNSRGKAVLRRRPLAVRTAGKYSVHEVNGPYTADKTYLFRLAPFAGRRLIPRKSSLAAMTEHKISDNLAWIFRALSVAVGIEAGRPRPPCPTPPAHAPAWMTARVRAGICRRRGSTRSFDQAPANIPIACSVNTRWNPSPTGCPPTAPLRRSGAVCILKHPSRYARIETERLHARSRMETRRTGKPEFQRLLNERPESSLTPREILGIPAVRTPASLNCAPPPWPTANTRSPSPPPPTHLAPATQTRHAPRGN